MPGSNSQRPKAPLLAAYVPSHNFSCRITASEFGLKFKSPGFLDTETYQRQRERAATRGADSHDRLKSEWRIASSATTSGVRFQASNCMKTTSPSFMTSTSTTGTLVIPKYHAENIYATPDEWFGPTMSTVRPRQRG